jgi:hypothetical protein
MSIKERIVNRSMCMVIGYGIIRVLSYIIIPRPYEFSHLLVDCAAIAIMGTVAVLFERR